MADPSSSSSLKTRITDLDEDSLAYCARFLNLQDISNLAMTCKYLKRAAYSDSVWQLFLREQWPERIPFGAREMYLSTWMARQQFKFVDPLSQDIFTAPEPFSHMLWDKNEIVFSQGSMIQRIMMDRYLSDENHRFILNEHKARITCMRLVSLDETSFLRSGRQRKDNLLVTSSSDHSIRLWWKDSCLRTFRGHNGPVLTVSDKVLGEDNSKILASGGEDGTVRLWSLSSNGKRGLHSLRATLHGHEKPVNFISVAGHKSSLLVSLSKDSKVRVWDISVASGLRSSCCVGMTSASGIPVNMKCHESLLYMAAGSSVIAIDLRTMQRVMTAAVCKPKLYSFQVVPSKSLVCTGSNCRAMLWDIRRNQGMLKAEPVAELDGHLGPVTLLHMDPYKIVTGRPNNCFKVWETDTGSQTSSFGFPISSAMAVDGFRIAIAGCYGEVGIVRCMDFANSTQRRVYDNEIVDEHHSKFWDPHSYNDDEIETFNSDE